MATAGQSQTAVGAVGIGGMIPTRTGGWALEQPVIDVGRCNVCLLCWVFCPDGTLHRHVEGGVEKPPLVDYAYCKGCGICARECPRGAISMVAR